MDCKGLSTIRGKDDIWMVLPKTFANRNIKRPICHSDRLYEREALFDSSRYDFRCNMSPMDWHAEESTAAVQPMTMLALDVDFDSSAMGGISGSVVRGVVSGVVDSMSDQGFVEVSTGNGVMRLLSENHHRKSQTSGIHES